MQTGVLIAGPNLTLDRTGTIAELRPGDVLRFERVIVTPGGKGLNVARAARALGADALLAGFVPGETGRVGADDRARGSRCARPARRRAALDRDRDRARRAARLRSTSPARGSAAPTGRGARGGDRALAVPKGVRPSIDSCPQRGQTPRGTRPKRSDPFGGGHGVLVCSGSVPPGSPDDAYARLVTLAAAADVPCVVDAAGVTLARALVSGPALSARTSPRPRRYWAPPAPGRRRQRLTRVRARWLPPRRSSLMAPARGHRRRGRGGTRDRERPRALRPPRRASRTCATRSARATCWRARWPPRSSAASRSSRRLAAASRRLRRAWNRRPRASCRHARPSCPTRSSPSGLNPHCLTPPR